MNTGEVYEKKEVLYPLGHKKRRAESLPFLKEKFEKSIEKADISHRMS